LATLTLAFKGKTLHVYPLTDGPLTIGRDSGCGIQIDSLAVEPQHARLMVHGNTATLTQCKHDNVTYLNHKPVEEQVLEDNDMIRVGKHVLLYRDDDAPVEKNDVDVDVIVQPAVQATPPVNHVAKQQPKLSQATNGWLQVMNGKMLGKTFKLRSGLTDLGKLGMLPALIALRSGGYFISNLANDDNLSVADKNIGDTSHPLHDGDVIKLGKITLQFHIQA